MAKPREASRHAKREIALCGGSSQRDSIVSASELGATLQSVHGSAERSQRSGGQVTPANDARDAWIAWLAPHFANNESCYFTGTYSDDYGMSNGLMLVRNVHKDFRRYLKSFDYRGKYVLGVEPHAFRSVLHLHAIIEGPLSEQNRDWMKRWWQAERGHARSLPVLDGCASYVTKYALKSDSDAFEWRLS